MARTNYSFEKRQRELAKKRKKEDKAAKKAAGGGEEELTPNDAAMALPPAADLVADDTDDKDDKDDKVGAGDTPSATGQPTPPAGPPA